MISINEIEETQNEDCLFVQQTETRRLTTHGYIFYHHSRAEACVCVCVCATILILHNFLFFVHRHIHF